MVISLASVYWGPTLGPEDMEVAKTGKKKPTSCWKAYIPVSKAGDKSINVSCWEILCAMEKKKKKI